MPNKFSIELNCVDFFKLKTKIGRYITISIGPNFQMMNKYNNCIKLLINFLEVVFLVEGPWLVLVP